MDPLKSLLEKPLITGASVSADKSSQSPGKKLSLEYTTPENIRMIAENGRMGREVIRLVTDADLRDRTIVLAIDFFFWDSALPSPSGSLKVLDDLCRRTTDLKVPLVLGEIPELIAGRQPGREKLNAAIHAKMKEHPNGFVMPFDELHQKLKRDGFLMLHGKKRTIQDLVPDGLHLSELAGDFLMEVLRSVLKREAIA